MTQVESQEHEALVVARNTLPASTEELAQALDIAPSRVAGLIRQLRKSGYPVKRESGIYRGAAQLDQHELAIMEHREISYCASRFATVAAMFPSEERTIIAQALGEQCEALEAKVKVHRRANVLHKRIDKAQRELEALSV
jgi:biotin operon repressor